MPTPAPHGTGYSRVKLATHRETGQQYAVKIIPLPKREPLRPKAGEAVFRYGGCGRQPRRRQLPCLPTDAANAGVPAPAAFMPAAGMLLNRVFCPVLCSRPVGEQVPVQPRSHHEGWRPPWPCLSAVALRMDMLVKRNQRALNHPSLPWHLCAGLCRTCRHFPHPACSSWHRTVCLPAC